MFYQIDSYWNFFHKDNYSGNTNHAFRLDFWNFDTKG